MFSMVIRYNIYISLQISFAGAVRIVLHELYTESVIRVLQRFVHVNSYYLLLLDVNVLSFQFSRQVHSDIYMHIYFFMFV